ncbi:Gfo/Idh/MocA family protein [Actinopolymorpha alba]|uniref:Gfo/Idh/MocA family protein n=1 Tax=Actinopolymorpha alba TaxID=533267 RepID=UPI00037B69CA|nr:Gfo/Idh/MocA family oxidoreductase [Actinopolymorpha alba]
MTLRVGVAGCRRGEGFLAGLRSLAGKAILTSVYDPDADAAQRFAAEHRIVTAASYEQLVDTVDAVVVASPQQYHAPQAIHALESGRHVLSEVPGAVSLEQAQALLAACRRNTATYMLAENYGYTRPNLVVGAMVAKGVFGDLYYAESEYLHEMKSWHTTPSGAPTWRYHWQVGRDGHTYPTHSLGPLLSWLDDRITAVSCVGTGRHTDPEHVISDTVLLLGRTARGALIRTRLDLLSNRPHLMDYFSIQGTGGAYEAGRAGEPGRVHVHGRTPDNTWEPIDRYVEEFLPEQYADPLDGSGHWGADSWPVRDFVAAIEAGERPPIDIYAALDMTLPGLVSEHSIAQGGAWLAVPDPRTWTAGIGVDPGREAPLT